MPAWRKKGLNRAQRVIAFVESLTITSGSHAGRPFRLRPWQKDIIQAVYGPETPEGLRRVRMALLTMARKNGKTGLVAALALCHLVGPEAEPRGQVYSAAADRNQASIIFREMKAMILADEDMAARIVIRDFNRELEDTETGSTYQALSADASTKHGFSASFVAYDELAQAPNRHLFDVLETSTSARSQPLIWVISTQSSDPTHVMSELVDYARDVSAGVVEDPTFVGFIYAAPEDADIFDESVWALANPALGDFRSLEEMRAYAVKARRLPARQAVFRALYLNQRIDASAGYLSGVDWRACGDPVDLDELAGLTCYGGLDLSSTRDLTAFVLWFPTAGALLAWFWIPAGGLDERENNDRVPYRVWIEAGHIETHPGRAIDRGAVARRVAEIVSPFDLAGLAFDRWRIEDFTKTIDQDGLDLPLKPWGQGFKDMSPALDALEDLVVDGKVRHGGHPVLTWNVSSAVLDIDPAGGRKLNKRRARARIDGLQAAAMAIGLAAREPVEVPQDWSLDLVVTV